MMPIRDTNILLYAQNEDCAEHPLALAFLGECAGRDDVALCELVLIELYQLLRYPAVVERSRGGRGVQGLPRESALGAD